MTVPDIMVKVCGAMWPCAGCIFLGGLVAWALVVAGKPGAAPFIVLGSFAGLGGCLCCYCSAGLWIHMDDGLAEGLADAAQSIDATIRAKLQTGTIRLLSCRWLLRTCGQPGAVLSRRQDLPDEAFLTPEEAVEAFEAGRVFVLSYGWQTPLHPDPLGVVLGLVVRFLASAWAAPFHPEAFGLFWDFASVPQKSPAGEERTESDKAVFKEALGAMSYLYGSLWRSAVIQVTELPAGGSAPAGVELNTRPYHHRGWCVMEEAAAQLATHHRGSSGDAVPKLMDISADEPVVYKAGQKPTIDRIENDIISAVFTGKGDKDVVMRQIREFNTKLSAGKRLSTLKPSKVAPSPAATLPSGGQRRPSPAATGIAS